MTVDPHWVFLVLLFGAVFAGAQAAQDLVKVGVNKRRVNRRLTVAGATRSLSELVIELRKQRGLTADGERNVRWRWFADLVMRSGVVYRPREWAIAVAVLAVATSLVGFLLTRQPVVVVAGLLLGPGLPLLALQVLAGRRAHGLGSQLPNALDVVVRSLEAGHPVPTAIALVGREMPDPIGSEFGMAADEIAFGASLEQAVTRMADRCRHPDVDLFAATVRLQERAGGNLTGLLKLNAKTVRERFKMRLRIKAASSEGRASAMILTAAPFIVVGVLALASPQYYAGVIHEPTVQKWLAGFGVWMFIGNAVMRRMINLKI